MEDGVLTYVPETDFNDVLKSLGMGGVASQAKTVQLPPFTLIGATTMPGLVSAPLRSRFVQSLNLEPYTAEELQQIVMAAGAKLAFKVSKPVAMEIARRSRNTARLAIGYLHWLREYCAASGDQPNMAALAEAFTLRDVDERGLNGLDRQYLRMLVTANAPVGLGSLSATLGESTATLTESIEPYLLREGYIRRSSRGRMAQQKAYDVVGKEG